MIVKGIQRHDVVLSQVDRGREMTVAPRVARHNGMTAHSDPGKKALQTDGLFQPNSSSKLQCGANRLVGQGHSSAVPFVPPLIVNVVQIVQIWMISLTNTGKQLSGDTRNHV
jgi:hypothetical protein